MTGEGWGEGDSSVVPAESLPRTRYGAGTQGGGRARSTAANLARTEPVLSTAEGSAHPEPNSSVVPAPTTVVPAKAGIHPVPLPSVHPEPVEGPRPEFTEGPADSSSVVPAKEPAEGRQNYEERKPRTRRTRTQRRRDGSARAAALRKGSKRNNEEKQDKPAPVELTIAERRINENSTSTGTSPTPGQDPSTPHTPAAHPPGDRHPTTQLNSERGRGLLPPTPSTGEGRGESDVQPPTPSTGEGRGEGDVQPPLPRRERVGVRVNGLRRNAGRRYPPMWYISTFSRGAVIAVLTSE